VEAGSREEEDMRVEQEGRTSARRRTSEHEVVNDDREVAEEDVDWRVKVP
jgi:hypothetical protein